MPDLVYKAPLCSLLICALLIAAHPSRAIETVRAPNHLVQGCPLMIGDIPVDTLMARTGKGLVLTLTPAKDRACLQINKLRLVTPEGKKMKAQRGRRMRTSVRIGVGTSSSGGGVSGSVGIPIRTGPGRRDTGSTYTFRKGLPEGRLAPGWMWTIEAYDICRKREHRLRIPVDRLASCPDAR